MKKLVVLLTLVATVSAFSQGQVNFNTKISASGIDAPVSYKAGGPVTADAKPNPTVSVASGSLQFGGIFAKAALYGGAAGSAESALTLLVPAVPFRSGAAAGYVDVTAATGGSTRTVQGVDVGQSAVFQVRAWDAGITGVDTYEAAIARQEYYAGKGNMVTVAQLGGGSIPTPVLTGIAGFQMTYVPEPSIIGLGILGAAAALMVFRRRE